MILVMLVNDNIDTTDWIWYANCKMVAPWFFLLVCLFFLLLLEKYGDRMRREIRYFFYLWMLQGKGTTMEIDVRCRQISECM